MKKTAGFFLVFTLIMGITGCGKKKDSAPVSSEPVTLRMAQTSAADGAVGLSMEKFAAGVNEKTNGRIKISVFHNGQLGTERDNVEACQLGNLDIAVVNQSVLTNFIPEIAAFDLPYVIQSTEHGDKVFLGDIGKEYLAKLPKVELQGLAIWESGFRNLTNSKRPVNALEDVPGLRIRVMENAIHQALWKSLGADPVPMAWGDAYTAMQQGAIDGQENPSTVIDKNNVVEVTKNMAVTQHVYSTVYIIMSTKAWKSLSAEDQGIIAAVMAEINISERELSRKMDKEAITTLESKGMKVTYPEKERFIAASQGVRDKYGEAYKDILDRINAAK